MKQTILTILALVLIPLLYHEAQAESLSCPNQIILLPNHRPSLLALSNESHRDEEVARKQFQVAQYLLTRKDFAVFSEFADQNLSTSSLPVEWNEEAQSVKATFPNGIPSDFQRLTQNQKATLGRFGADWVLFLLGQLPTLHRTVIDQSANDRIIERIVGISKLMTADDKVDEDSELYQLVFITREAFALMEIQNYINQRGPQNPLILVYGGDHSFNSHPEIFDPKCIERPIK